MKISAYAFETALFDGLFGLRRLNLRADLAPLHERQERIRVLADAYQSVPIRIDGFAALEQRGPGGVNTVVEVGHWLGASGLGDGDRMPPRPPICPP